MDSIAAIEHNPGTSIEDVKAQEDAYEELRKRFIEKYLHLANLGSALYYNLEEIGTDVWRPLADYAIGRAVEHPQTQQFENWLDAATMLAGEKHSFHWGVEFSTIFFYTPGHRLSARACVYVVM